MRTLPQIQSVECVEGCTMRHSKSWNAKFAWLKTLWVTNYFNNCINIGRHSISNYLTVFLNTIKGFTFTVHTYNIWCPSIVGYIQKKMKIWIIHIMDQWRYIAVTYKVYHPWIIICSGDSSFMPFVFQSLFFATILALSQSTIWFSLITWSVMADLCLSGGHTTCFTCDGAQRPHAHAAGIFRSSSHWSALEHSEVKH